MWNKLNIKIIKKGDYIGRHVKKKLSLLTLVSSIGYFWIKVIKSGILKFLWTNTATRIFEWSMKIKPNETENKNKTKYINVLWFMKHKISPKIPVSSENFYISIRINVKK